MDSDESALGNLCIQLQLAPKDASKWTFEIQCQQFISVSYLHNHERVRVKIPPHMRPHFYLQCIPIFLKGQAMHFDMHEPLQTPACLTTREHFYLLKMNDGQKGIIGVNVRDDYMALQWWIYYASSDACVYIGGRENAQKLYDSFLAREKVPSRFYY